MDINDFDYELPESLIAQVPLKERSASRLLVLDKRTGEIRHQMFVQLIDHLKPGDVLVFNDSKVLPARLFGVKEETGAKVEILLLRQLDTDVWETLAKPGKRLAVGTRIRFGNSELTGIVESVTAGGERVVRFEYQGIFQEVLDRLGEMPLPPYIKTRLEDKGRYQTVYAAHEGSVAAPTAGLHFTQPFFERLKAYGVELAFVTLHVGLGTFRPVKMERIEEHRMHAEYFIVNESTADQLRRAKAEGRRVIAVGTTPTRVLESVMRQRGKMTAASGWTDIFIYPGYTFQAIDGLLTNFHLPKSTLLMLVSALAGRENILRAYAQAVKEKYRFFSFGDAMLIL
jgi:S-adenosylmethionine:tRNA ribosyltransferase-isomerase